MQDILRFLLTYEIWIYVILGVVIFSYLRKLILAIQEWRGSVFGLEREIAQRRFGSSITVIGLMILAGFGVFIMVSFVAPSYPQVLKMLTPTLDLMATPTTTLEPGSLISGGVLTRVPEGTPVPAGEASEGCKKGVLEWIYPQNGEEVSGTIELKGTVQVPNLGFYKYEFSQAGSNTWTTIAAGDKAKMEEALGGVWNTSQLVPGDYFLRLVVTDNQNETVPACQISIRILTE